MSTYNLENLYDFRDDPTDGCDFAGNTGCPGVSPPFDYVPAQPGRPTTTGSSTSPTQITVDLHSPDILLTQEAEDQDICSIVAGALACGGPEAGDGKPDTLQELALAIAAAGGGSLRRRLRPRRRRRPGHRVGLPVPDRPGDPGPGDGRRPRARRGAGGRVPGAGPAVRTPTCPTPRRSTPSCPTTSTRRPAPTAATSTPGRRRWRGSGWRPGRAARDVRPVGDQQPLLVGSRRPGGPAHRAGRPTRAAIAEADRGGRPDRPGRGRRRPQRLPPARTTRSPRATRCSRPTSSARSTSPG